MAPTSDDHWEILTVQRMAGVCQVLAHLLPSPVNKTGTLGAYPHGGLRPFHQKSTCLTQLTPGPCVVHFWSRNTPAAGENETRADLHRRASLPVQVGQAPRTDPCHEDRQVVGVAAARHVRRSDPLEALPNAHHRRPPPPSHILSATLTTHPTQLFQA